MDANEFKSWFKGFCEGANTPVHVDGGGPCVILTPIQWNSLAKAVEALTCRPIGQVFRAPTPTREGLGDKMEIYEEVRKWPVPGPLYSDKFVPISPERDS